MLYFIYWRFMALVVLIKTPNGALVDVPLFGSTVVVGRSSKADIKIDDTLISGRHFSIEYKNNAVFYKDLGSTNGSFLNNSKIINVQLRVGDKIKFGNSTLFIDESKLTKQEKEHHSHPAGNTNIQYIKMDYDNPGASSSIDKGVLDDDEVDVLSRLEAKEAQRKKEEEEKLASKNKKRPSIGADLAKKVIDKKTMVSTVAFNPKEKNFDIEKSTGNTKFIELEKAKRDKKARIQSQRSSMETEEEKPLGLIESILKALSSLFGGNKN